MRFYRVFIGSSHLAETGFYRVWLYRVFFCVPPVAITNMEALSLCFLLFFVFFFRCCCLIRSSLPPPLLSRAILLLGWPLRPLMGVKGNFFFNCASTAQVANNNNNNNNNPWMGVDVKKVLCKIFYCRYSMKKLFISFFVFFSPFSLAPMYSFPPFLHC